MNEKNMLAAPSSVYIVQLLGVLLFFLNFLCDVKYLNLILCLCCCFFEHFISNEINQSNLVNESGSKAGV